VKILNVKANNRRKAFEIQILKQLYFLPYAKLEHPPSSENRITDVYIDKEIGSEGFTYQLASGIEDTIHMDRVLEYNQDPDHLREMLFYKLTIEAQKRIAKTALSKREIIRRLNTSATQFYRLIDQTNTRKSMGRLLSLLQVLDCDVEVVVTDRV
jgi:hypothetical protein